jgi:hypothetical protein
LRCGRTAGIGFEGSLQPAFDRGEPNGLSDLTRSGEEDSCNIGLFRRNLRKITGAPVTPVEPEH